MSMPINRQRLWQMHQRSGAAGTRKTQNADFWGGPLSAGRAPSTVRKSALAECTPVNTRNPSLQPLREAGRAALPTHGSIPAKSVVGRRAGGLCAPHSRAAVGSYCDFETVPTNPHRYRWHEIQGAIWRCGVRPPRLHKDTFIFVRERRKSAAPMGDTDACSNE